MRYRLLPILVILTLALGLSACKRSPRVLASMNNTAASEIAVLDKGGSSEWDDKVKLILLRHFDLDGSGWIDTRAEVDAIACDTWTVAERSLANGGQYSQLRPIYGFGDGFIWVGSALGFDEVVRAIADAEMANCGLPLP